LTLFYQGQIANSFHYPQKNVLRRSESFMRDYYQHARTIYLTAKRVTEGFLLPDLSQKEQKPVFGFLAKRKLKTEQFDGFYSHGRLIYAENPEVFHEDPFRLIRVFLYAQQRELELSSELQQLIRRRTRLVNRTFQYARAARETFQAILSRKGQVGHIIRTRSIWHSCSMIPVKHPGRATMPKRARSVRRRSPPGSSWLRNEGVN
jgi:[protein-PII] uridylyltransferase